MVQTYVITEFYLPKVAAVLSMLGSSLILAEIYQDQKQSGVSSGGMIRGISAISQILLSMSIGDILFSFGWFLGSWVAPPQDHNYLQGTNHGTYGSCVFQGFIFQMGYMASLFFSASLAMVYLLMIRYNWRQARLQRWIPMGTIGLWLFCIATALTPLFLDMYHSVGPVCWIASPAAVDCSLKDGNESAACQESRDATSLIFSLQVIPVWLCIILDSIIMFLIYRKARSLETVTESRRNASPRISATGVQSTTSRANDNSNNNMVEKEPEKRDEINKDGRAENMEQDQETTPSPRVKAKNGKEQQSTASVSVGRYSSTTSQYSPTNPTRNRSKRMSRVVARQGMAYIAGFFLTYGFATIGVIVFIATGEWNPPLDRTSYFFLACQGIFNFLIFSHGRREMKTGVGAKLKSCIWENKLRCCRPCMSCLAKDRDRWTTNGSTSSRKRQTGNNGSKTRKGSNSGQNVGSQQEQDKQSEQQPLHSIAIEGMLSPIDEEVGRREEVPQEKIPVSSSHSRISRWVGFLIRAKQSVASQFVSELGASGYSSSSDDDYSESQYAYDTTRQQDHPPSQPYRVNSRIEMMPGKVPPCKPVRMASGPTIPTRFISELSEVSSYDNESHIEALRSSTGNAPPMQPIRYASEVSNFEQDVDDAIEAPLRISTSSAPPMKPIRYASEFSEVSTFDDGDDIEAPLRTSTSSAPPMKPMRFASEASEVSSNEGEDGQVEALPMRSSTGSAPPTKPMRFSSEVSEASTTEEDDEMNAPIQSGPPAKPQRIASEVCEVSSDEEEDSHMDTSPPTKPVRIASTVDPLDD